MALKHYTVIYDDQRPFEYQFHWHGRELVRVFSQSRFNLHWEETDVFMVSGQGVLSHPSLAEVLDSVAGWLETH